MANFMRNTQESADVGVVVGRFQVNNLHIGHEDLLNEVLERHEKVIVLLGVSPLAVSRENPLDFEARERMLKQWEPKLTVLPIYDAGSDEYWSGQLDATLAQVVSPTQSVILYGGRDSFIKHYSGSHKTQELEHAQETFYSGSEVRDRLRRSVINSDDFRAGVIWAAYNQYPKVVPTVDVAIYNEDETKLLLGRKPGEDYWRFVGGHADPNKDSYELDAMRELHEEAGSNLNVTPMEYIGSFYIDDWRYRNESDAIKTIFFKTRVLWGRPEPGSDISELRWFDVNRLGADFTKQHPNHKPLFAALRKRHGVHIPK